MCCLFSPRRGEGEGNWPPGGSLKSVFGDEPPRLTKTRSCNRVHTRVGQWVSRTVKQNKSWLSVLQNLGVLMKKWENVVFKVTMRILNHTVYNLKSHNILLKRINIHVFPVTVRSIAAGKMSMKEHMSTYIWSVNNINYLKLCVKWTYE